jgi:hypothetical protein
MQSTILIVISMKKTSEVSIALSKRSHLEVIRVDWQQVVDRQKLALSLDDRTRTKSQWQQCTAPRPWQYKTINFSQ